MNLSPCQHCGTSDRVCGRLTRTNLSGRGCCDRCHHVSMVTLADGATVTQGQAELARDWLRRDLRILND